MTHTKGKWEDRGMGVVSAHTPSEFRGESFTIGTSMTFVCQCSNVNGLADNWEANARLIAAAPDMLEALEWAIEQLDAEYVKRIAVTKYTANGMELAHQAIAKAKGE